MTSVDDLFRKPNQAPPTSNKRKIQDPTSSVAYRSQSNKSAKFNNGTSPHSSQINGQSKSELLKLSERPPQAATVEEDEVQDEDMEAGPSLPPPDNEEEEQDDDEEGRFFGGGVTREGRQALDFLDETTGADGEVPKEEVYDTAWLRRTTLSFQKKIDKNAEMRAKYAEQPQKFIQSEADLDEEMKGLGILSEHSELYNEFAKIPEGGVESLISLLGHENTDIAMRAVQVMAELTDEDTDAEESQWKSLVQAMLEAGVPELLVSNLGRLNESEETDRDGVYHVLELVENLSSDAVNTEKLGTQEGLLDWLLQRAKKHDENVRGRVGQNRQYAAEVLAILLQGSAKNRFNFAEMDGVVSLLELLNAYQRLDPEKDSDEEEYAENLFDCLTCSVDDLRGSEKFLESDGIELCLFMLQKGSWSKARALRVLDHAMGGANGVAVCEDFVDRAGLKTVFGMFMKKKKGDKETLEHLIGVFASLLRYLPGESAGRIRTLAKFVEKDYEKIVKLVALKTDYADRVARVSAEIEEEKNLIDAEDYELMEAEWFSRKLEAGLFALQTLDVIVSWLAAEDDGARKKISELLGGLESLKRSLQEQLDGIDTVTSEKSSGKEMLEALLECL